MSDVTNAVLTIHRAAEMCPKKRKELAAWLRRQAFQLEFDWGNMAPLYRARYVTVSTEAKSE